MNEKTQEIQELNALYKKINESSKYLIGYPASLLFNYSKLFRFLKFPINNIGDFCSPPNSWRMNTLCIEKLVIERLSRLFHAPKNDYWGYITNGGTEGNLHGLYIGRELYPDGVVYLSDQAHYSALKNIRILRMPYICIPSQPNGEIDYQIFRNALIENRKKGPPILFVNIGTTMKGAIDDLQKIRDILSELRIEKYYIHCDAALYGMILPFIRGLNRPFDFSAGIDSIVISGHKTIGSPIPCGAIITKKTHISKIGNSIEYVGIKDNTISGSRNGITPLFFWHELIYMNGRQFEKRVKSCFAMAQYVVDQFNAKGIPAWRNSYSLTIILPRPSEKLNKKWQFPVEGNMSCMLILPHLTRKMVDQFIREFLLAMKD